MGHPVTGDSLKRFGTPVLMNYVNKFGVLPVNNFKYGKFDKAGEISGEAIAKYKEENKTCAMCPMACKRTIKLDGKTMGSPEYESIWALGPDCGLGDLKQISEANKFCNDYGLDTITAGGVCAFAIDAFKQGKIKEDDIGFSLDWGSSESVLGLLKLVVERSKIGDTLAEGTKSASKKIGAEELAMQVKGLEFAAYDPRGLKGQALSYATANQGATHLHAYAVPQELLTLPDYVNALDYSGKAELVKKLQDISSIVDSLVICKFTTFAVYRSLKLEIDIFAKLLTAATGFYFDEESLLETGERIYNLERLFNIREGFGRKDDKLPDKFKNEELERGAAEGQTVDVERMLDEYYEIRGWDREGVPTEGKLSQLDISHEERFPKLQIALDLRDWDQAIRLAEAAVKGGVDIVEAGTPLIKENGLGIVKELRKRFPNKIIVADLKTMDTGYMETEMAAQAGADIVCILGTADDSTIIDAVGAGKKFGIKVEVDLIAVPNEKLVERAKEVAKLGADYICFHIGVDKQMRSDYEKIPFPTLAQIAKELDIPIAAAGGLKADTIPLAVESGAKMLIVGGAITRAGDPEKATRSLADLISSESKKGKQ